MICFEVVVNCEKLCTAGIRDIGVLTATISCIESRSHSNDMAPFWDWIARPGLN
jgi:hypothetical protein